jgi:hypothetical protein
VLEVKNNRASPITCAIEFTLPSGWTAAQSRVEATVEPGEKKLIPLPITVAADEPRDLVGSRRDEPVLCDANAMHDLLVVR